MSDDRLPPSFPHGVASFEPTAEGILLWTRVEGATTVRWTMTTDLQTFEPVVTGEVPVEAETGIAVVEVVGLEPATTYHYRFDVGPQDLPLSSPIGRTRTLPGDGVERIRLATICCADYAAASFAVLRALAEQEVDLVVHLGDYIYETPDEGFRTPQPRHDLVTLEDYRTRYGHVRADPDLLALHQRHPMVTTWDDHDIADNAWRFGAKAHDPQEHGPWDERLQAAARARQEWLPARLRDPEDPTVLWRSMALGDLAELVLLDTRFVGRDCQAGDPGAKPVEDPSRSLLGRDQRRWAYERIADTSRPWCLLASQVVVSPLSLSLPTGATLAARAPSGYAVIDGTALCTDEWDGYPAERAALAHRLRQRGGGTVILSGDVHSAWLIIGPEDAFGPVAAEVVAPSISSTPMAAQLPRAVRRAGEVLTTSDQVVWADLEHYGFVVVDVTREEVRADWFWVDPLDPGARARHAAAFRIGPSLPPPIERLTVGGARPVTEAADPPEPVAEAAEPTEPTEPTEPAEPAEPAPARGGAEGPPVDGDHDPGVSAARPEAPPDQEGEGAEAQAAEDHATEPDVPTSEDQPPANGGRGEEADEVAPLSELDERPALPPSYLPVRSPEALLERQRQRRRARVKAATTVLGVGAAIAVGLMRRSRR